MVILLQENATLIHCYAHKDIMPMMSVTYACCLLIVRQLVQNITSPKIQQKNVFLNVYSQIMVTVFYGHVSQSATTHISVKILQENVCQAAVHTYLLPKTKTICVFKNVQPNRLDTLPKMQLIHVLNLGNALQVVMLKTTLVYVFCTVQKLQQ